MYHAYCQRGLLGGTVLVGLVLPCTAWQVTATTVDAAGAGATKASRQHSSSECVWVRRRCPAACDSLCHVMAGDGVTSRRRGFPLLWPPAGLHGLTGVGVAPGGSLMAVDRAEAAGAALHGRPQACMQPPPMDGCCNLGACWCWLWGVGSCVSGHSPCTSGQYAGQAIRAPWESPGDYVALGSHQVLDIYIHLHTPVGGRGRGALDGCGSASSRASVACVAPGRGWECGVFGGFRGSSWFAYGGMAGAGGRWPVPVIPAWRLPPSPGQYQGGRAPPP